MGTCPLTVTTYKGKCVNRKCFAWHNEAVSNCLQQTDRSSVLSIFKMSKLRFKKVALEQIEMLYALINVKHTLEQIPAYYKHCSKCGKRGSVCHSCNVDLSILENIKEFYGKLNIAMSQQQAYYFKTLKNYQPLLPLYKKEWQND